MPADIAASAPRLALLALPLLALLVAAPAAAGPPEAVSGRMVFDVVADGLRKYARETDPEMRARRLAALAPSQDPRVAVALGEAMQDPSPAVLAAAFRGAAAHYGAGTSTAEVCAWWKQNEADLRRRAQELPR
jgi:hypothetical protein